MRQRDNRLRCAVGLLTAALPLAAILPGPAPAGAEATTRAPAAELEIVDLGVLPGGTASFASDLNDDGDVVGSSDVGETISHAFLWRQGRMTDLGTLGGGQRDSSAANAINELGLIVGSSTAGADAGDFAMHAVLWSDGGITDLGTLGGPESVATDVNDRGEIVGYSTTATGATHAFLWRRGRMIDLGAPEGDDFSIAKAINDRGKVVATTGAPAPFVWQRGTWSSVEPMPATDGLAEDINDRGHVVGLVFDPAAVNRAAVWRGGAPVDLGLPEGEGSQATAINDRGQIVGNSFENGAFLWERGTTTRLPALVPLAAAEAVNESGQVAGYSATQEGIDPRYHAVIWR